MRAKKGGKSQFRLPQLKEIIADPVRDVVLQRTRFVPLQGTLADYHLYLLLAPHLGNRGYSNTGWVGDYKGIPMLFAEREEVALALASSGTGKEFPRKVNARVLTLLAPALELHSLQLCLDSGVLLAQTGPARAAL